MQQIAGRPSTLDDVASTAVVDAMNAANKRTKSQFYNDWGPIISAAAMASDARRGKRVIEEIYTAPSDSTLLRIQKQLKVSFCKPQDHTIARLHSLLDIRAAFKMAVVCIALSRKSPGEYKFNADATSAIIKKSRSGALVMKVVGAGEEDGTDSGPRSI
jgi:hypothetical protein